MVDSQKLQPSQKRFYLAKLSEHPILVGLALLILGAALDRTVDTIKWSFFDWLESRDEKITVSIKIDTALEEIEQINAKIRSNEELRKKDKEEITRNLTELRGHVIRIDDMVSYLYGRGKERTKRNLKDFEAWMHKQKELEDKNEIAPEYNGF